MMDLDNNTTKKTSQNKSKFLHLLLCIKFLFALPITSCVSEAKKTDLKKNKETSSLQKNDSIKINFIFHTKANAGFNVTDKYHFAYYEGFKNSFDKKDTIQRAVYSPHDKQILYFGNFEKLDGKYVLKKRGFLVSKENPVVNVFYKDRTIQKQNNSKIIDLTNFYDAYAKAVVKKENTTLEIKQKIDATYNALKQKYANNATLSEVNDLFYYSKLSAIQPLEASIESYLLNLKAPISSVLFNTLLVNYVKGNINRFKYNKLTEEYFPEKYIENISIGVFNLLRYEDYKGDKDYVLATNWLKTTDMYKNDSLYIKKEIEPLDNELFISKLKKLSVYTKENDTYSFSEILNKYPNNYYLIDFWATWCAPCIKGVKLMNTMKLPENISIISVSIDKKKDIQKWIQKTNDLNQRSTFWIDVNETKTNDFVKLIEMESIPRYILIDKDGNLIDQAFYHPNEPQFLSKLQDIKNYKYW
ncbi:MAG: TlpA disulfide reductase family protein [Bacteroidota bacterium]